MGRSYWEEGFTGTTIKDTWTKSRGKVEGIMGGKEELSRNMYKGHVEKANCVCRED